RGWVAAHAVRAASAGGTALRGLALALPRPASDRRWPEGPEPGRRADAARGAATGRPGPTPLDLFAPALHPAHAGTLLPANQRGTDYRHHPQPGAKPEGPARRIGRPAA